MPTDPTPTEREMPDDEVDFMLTGYLNPTWEFVRVGDEEYWRDPAGKRWGMEEYCSPDAPVSLRIEMVDAVEAAAAKWEKEFPASKRITRPNPWAVFFDAVDIELSSEAGAAKDALRLKQGPFARGVLAALESAGRGGAK